MTGHLLGDLVRELESRGMLRTVLAPASTPVATVNVSGVCFDSRSAQAGDLFVAVPGDITDGHDHAQAAVAGGAVAIVGERAVGGVDVPQILVSSARSALAVAAAWANGFPSHELGVVGITGTDGKTTTSYLVQRMLVECGLAAGLITTIDVIIGGQSVGYTGHTTPEAPVIQADLRRMLDAGDQFAVVETTSHGLALERVAEIAYDIAVFTNLTHEHLDLHGTYEAYVSAKRSLFDRLEVTQENPQKQWPKGAVVNAQDERGPEMAAAAGAAGARVLTYAVDADVGADIVATSVHDDGRALRMQVRTAALGRRGAHRAARAVQRVQRARRDRSWRAARAGSCRDAPRPGRRALSQRADGAHRRRAAVRRLCRLRAHARRPGRGARRARSGRGRARWLTDFNVRVTRRARHRQAPNDGPRRRRTIADRGAH